MSEEGFFSRWARRKSEVRSGRAAEEQPPSPNSTAQPQARTVAPVPPGGEIPPAESKTAAAATEGVPAAPAVETEPLPSMDDVARLRPDSDYSSFMRQGVDENVKRAAMKKLFTDPHYNVMDGLDIYIDDYSKPDPIPASMLRKMVQSQLLGLFRDEDAEKEKQAAVADATSIVAPTHDSEAGAVPQSRAEEPPIATPAVEVAAPTESEARTDGAALHATSPAPADSPLPDGRLSDPGVTGRPTDRS